MRKHAAKGKGFSFEPIQYPDRVCCRMERYLCDEKASIERVGLYG